MIKKNFIFSFYKKMNLNFYRVFAKLQANPSKKDGCFQPEIGKS